MTAPARAGEIKGFVRFTGPTPDAKTLPVTSDQYVCGKEKEVEDLVLSPDKGIRNAVVWLAAPPPGAKWGAHEAAITIDQKQCSFVPRVVVVPVGGTVKFLNGDRLLHNIHSHGKVNPSFNRTQPKGRDIPVTFNKPEIVRIDCDLHDWMRAWVVVAEHPFYAVTGPNGEFTLGAVPAGTYNLSVWHESLGTTTKGVTVGQGETSVVIEMGKR
ncbi:MAG TPA: carboxypeptidase regulatory-like domain-containing protein [Candidatus Methylomirabilis sp.]|nr:carboxypeptidase regulatory-like domain-containing protein [Candidatus Methylomirabilis sp.]